jgi:hypothetical protein
MKYIANPIEVDAHKIVSIGVHEGGIHFALENGQNVTPTPEMRSRMEPKVGDYWVIQSDGYIYLNQKDVFERKYAPVTTSGMGMGATGKTQRQQRPQ